MMTSRELIRWSRLHDKRAEAAAWWRFAIFPILGIGCPIAAFVKTRTDGVADAAGAVAGSHAWLAGALVAFAVAFLRAPFLVYWRSDAALLAQLPIEGRALFDAALARCVRSAAIVTAAVAIGALPLLDVSPDLLWRHLALAGALGAVAAFGMPAVVVGAAATLQQGIVATVTALGGAPAAPERSTAAKVAKASAGVALGVGVGVVAGARAGSAASQVASGNAGSSTMLGAIPGFAATGVFVVVVIASPWLVGAPARIPGPAMLIGVAAVSVAALLLARGSAGARMGAILRDVSALDRQRLAALEIRPPTALERAIGRLAGAGALAYAKDARLVRRRYPMAYALGALAFLVLAIVGFAQPDDPLTYVIVAAGGSGAYAIVLAGRLRRAPIELPRLAEALPIAPAARRRAKHAWLVGWWTIYVVVPGAFALARNPTPACAAVLGGATLAVLSREWLPDRITSSRAPSVSGG